MNKQDDRENRHQTTDAELFRNSSFCESWLAATMSVNCCAMDDDNDQRTTADA